MRDVCPFTQQTDEWIKKMWNTHNGLLLSHKKKETQMDLGIIIRSEISHADKDTHRMISLICGIQNTTQMNSSLKQTQTYRHREQICGLQGETGVVGDGLREFGISRCKLLCIGWKTTWSYCIAQGTIFNTLR